VSGVERPVSGVRRSHRVWVVALTAAAVVAADQTTKSVALDRLQNGPIHLLGPLSFALSFNSGVAFSLGSGLTVPILVIGVVLVVILIWFAHAAPSYPVAVGTGLILGGALGNLADRIFRGHNGAVVDFVHLGFWPTFNLADFSIVVGAVLLVASFSWRLAEAKEDGAGA
jgi:signal peptidase II